jgi:hypothetical protein
LNEFYQTHSSGTPFLHHPFIFTFTHLLIIMISTSFSPITLYNNNKLSMRNSHKQIRQQKTTNQPKDSDEQKDLAKHKNTNQRKGYLHAVVDSYKYDIDGWKHRTRPYDFPKSAR